MNWLMRLALVLFLSATGCTPATPKCTATSCPGCCSSTGRCEVGTSVSACGRGGASCSSCTLGNICSTGMCVPFSSGTGGGTVAGGGSAGGGSVAGGDAGGGAVTGGGSTAGGSTAGGSTAGGSTAGGSTAGGSTAGGAGGGSGGGAACDGCLAAGNCLGRATAQQNDNVCGTAGQVCMACGGTTPRCINGACQPLGAKAVGDSCFASSECQASLGQQAVCKTQTLAGNFQYPDGVCTYERCSASNCPAMSTCIGLSRIFGEETTMCVASNCGTGGTQGTCRSGWVCVGTATTFCIPQAMVQAGAGASYDRTTLIGTPCVSNGACRAPTPGAPGAGGLCISELSRFADGGIRPGADGGVIETGYLSGYCSRDCRSDRDCVSMPPETGDADLSDGVCLGVSTTLAVCFKGCTAPMAGQSNCRPSYVCRALTLRDGGTLPTGYCGPSCTNPGSSCALADGGPGSCNTATGYCN